MKNSGFAILSLLLALFILSMLINLSFKIPNQIMQGFKRNKQYFHTEKQNIDLNLSELESLNCETTSLQTNLINKVCGEKTGNFRLNYIEQR